jgi:hypothetical protein
MTLTHTPPDLLSPRERALEVASIIATAVARLDATRTRERDIQLALLATKSVHTNPSLQGVAE